MQRPFANTVFCLDISPVRDEERHYVLVAKVGRPMQWRPDAKIVLGVDIRPPVESLPHTVHVTVTETNKDALLWRHALGRKEGDSRHDRRQRH